MHVVFYDGVCALCNRTVRLLLAIDTRRKLRFAPLQGTTAQKIASSFTCGDPPVSVVFVQNLARPDEEPLQKSDAIIAICRTLGGAWSVAGVFSIIPRPIRDGLYDFVARKRYRWFGKFNQCALPPERYADLFLP